jgi:polysaccharide chain length determinant protein (PEP-CTERM system associated)
VEQHQEQTSRNLEQYWAIARRRRWWLVLPLFFIWALCFAASWFIAKKYRSETVIIVEQQRSSDRNLPSNVGTDVQELLQSMTEQILSRTRLQGIIQRFHLYGQDQQSANSDAAVEAMRQGIKIDLVPVPGRQWELSAFKVSYSAPRPALAQQVTQELISLFIEENLRNRQRAAESTTEFLESQLQETGKSVARQEERLQQFKSQHLGELPEQLANNTQILSGLESRLQAAEEALDEANQEEVYLGSMRARNRGLPSDSGNGTDQALISPVGLDAQLDQLNAELADLRTRYTLQHPDVQRVKQRIALMEKLKQQLEAASQSHKSDGSQEKAANTTGSAELAGRSPTPEANSLLHTNRTNIVYRQQEVKRLEKEIALYQARLNMTPLREQQLAAITRDHDQSRANYESLLAKKTQSEMVTDLEKRQQGELFRIIDPPNLPQKPYWPNRFKLSLLGLLLGTMVAIGITALMESIDGRIDSEEELRNLLTAPVLAGIPLLQTAAEQRKRDWRWRIEVVTASLLLLVMPGMTLIAYYRG